ncbi:MAG: hypothetical protein ABI472_24025 [Ginsengibacter sp.]
MSNPRIYKGKDVEMLMTVSTLIETAITNQDFLIPKQSCTAS